MSKEKGDFVDHSQLTPQQAMNEVEKVRVVLLGMTWSGEVPQVSKQLSEMALSLEEVVQAINEAFGVLPDSWKAETNETS